MLWEARTGWGEKWLGREPELVLDEKVAVRGAVKDESEAAGWYGK